MKKLKKKYIIELPIIMPDNSVFTLGDVEPIEGISDKDIPMSPENAEYKMLFELAILNKTLDLMQAGKLRNFSELKELYQETKYFNNLKEVLGDIEKIANYYDPDSPDIKEERSSGRLKWNLVKPALKDWYKDAPKPAFPLRISKCCGTCKFFKNASNSSRGFCSLKQKAGLNIRYKYGTDKPLKERQQEKRAAWKVMAKHYPVVHMYSVCDAYIGTRRKKRLLWVAKMIKRHDELLVYDSEVN